MKERFSKRYGINLAERPITIRYDAPDELRYYVSTLLLQFNKGTLKHLRSILCTTAMISPDPSNWGENDYMKSEIESIIERCDWFRVYEIIEVAYEEIVKEEYREEFENNINEFFIEYGIGWRMENGELLIRGNETFEKDISETSSTLKDAGLNTSAEEIRQAILDLSRIPEPDITGAVQHSGAALECVAREVVGSKETLGALIKAHPEIVPSPINEVVSKLFGYASEKGRHLREGILPSFDEAELIVRLSASLCSYLCKKHFPSHLSAVDDLPF
ncbi:MAG: hypothetical protein IJQ83_04470 [Bacteroidales bacterium]|nr:hypothetical protein [Bacteroidales bacterium]